MFGFGKRKKGNSSLESTFERISQMLTDDDLQLRILGPQEYSKFKSLTAIDKRHNGGRRIRDIIYEPDPN